MSNGYFTRKQRRAADEDALAEIRLQPAQFVLDHRRAPGHPPAKPQHPHTTRTGCCRASPAARTQRPRVPRPVFPKVRAWAAGPGGRLQPWGSPPAGRPPPTTGRRCWCVRMPLGDGARPAASPGRRRCRARENALSTTARPATGKTPGPRAMETRSAGTSIGASTTLMRSWLVEVKSTSRVVSEVSVTPDTKVIEWTCTSGNCLVSSSAVSSSRTRSMISELLSPSPARP